MNCHKELPDLANIYGLRKMVCPVCGLFYYEEQSVKNELDSLEKKS